MQPMPPCSASQPSLSNACILSWWSKMPPSAPRGSSPPNRMPPASLRDARWEPGAENFNTKFGLRPMKSLRKTVPAVAAAVLALSLLPLAARTPQQAAAPPPQAKNPAPTQQQPQQPPAIRVPVNQVVIPVTVKDGSGRLVPDLRKEEFRILEDNVEQRIVFFSADAVPLSMVLLIDNDLNR